MTLSITPIASSSKGNCYLIDNGTSRILIECGIPWKQIQVALNFQTSSINGILLSHGHKDHSFAAKDAIKYGVDIYMTYGTHEEIGTKDSCSVKYVRAKEFFKVGTFSVMSFDVEHDAKEPLGFLILSGNDRLMFLTDTSYCRYKFAGISHLMIECNFSRAILDRNFEKGLVEASRRKRLIESHMSLERVIDFLKANDLSRLREIHLIHLSENNSDEQYFGDEIRKLTGVPVFVAPVNNRKGII